MLNYHRERFRKLTFSRVSPSSFALTKRQLSKSVTVVIHPLSTRLIKAELVYKSHMFLKIKGPYGSSRRCKRHLWYGARYIIFSKFLAPDNDFPAF